MEHQFRGARRAPLRGLAGAAVAREAQGALRRLTLDRARIDVPPAVAWTAGPEARSQAEIEFSWVGDTARRVGSVVHRYLQRIAEDEAKDWNRKRIEGEKPAIRAALAARGVVDAEIDAATARE